MDAISEPLANVPAIRGGSGYFISGALEALNNVTNRYFPNHHWMVAGEGDILQLVSSNNGKGDAGAALAAQSSPPSDRLSSSAFTALRKAFIVSGIPNNIYAAEAGGGADREFFGLRVSLDQNPEYARVEFGIFPRSFDCFARDVTNRLWRRAPKLSDDLSLFLRKPSKEPIIANALVSWKTVHAIARRVIVTTGARARNLGARNTTRNWAVRQRTGLAAGN